MGRAPPNEVRSIAMLLLPLLIATHEHPVQVIDMIEARGGAGPGARRRRPQTYLRALAADEQSEGVGELSVHGYTRNLYGIP